MAMGGWSRGKICLTADGNKKKKKEKWTVVGKLLIASQGSLLYSRGKTIRMENIVVASQFVRVKDKVVVSPHNPGPNSNKMMRKGDCVL